MNTPLFVLPDHIQQLITFASLTSISSKVDFLVMLVSTYEPLQAQVINETIIRFYAKLLNLEHQTSRCIFETEMQWLYEYVF